MSEISTVYGGGAEGAGGAGRGSKPPGEGARVTGSGDIARKGVKVMYPRRKNRRTPLSPSLNIQLTHSDPTKILVQYA